MSSLDTRLFEDDRSVRLKSNAYGDTRPYLRTNTGDRPGSPQRDELAKGVVWWFGKRLYVGNKTMLYDLFHLLADHPGRWHSVTEIEQIVFKTRLALATCDDDRSRRESRQARQRLRKLISRLKERMREHGLDDHAIVVPTTDKRRGPGYVLLLFQHQKYEDGDAPHPQWDGQDIRD